MIKNLDPGSAPPEDRDACFVEDGFPIWQTASRTFWNEPKTERLVILAIAVGAGLQGAVHSHVRRGLAAGLTREELEQVAILAITTVGWPSALAALSWIAEEIDKPG